MSDKAVNMQATDLFALGSGFEVQSSSRTLPAEVVEGMDADGDLSQQKEYQDRLEYQAEYEYAGSALETDFVAKVGKCLTGAASEVILLDRVTITLAPRKRVRLSLQGHNHGQNAHAVSTTPGELDGYSLDLATLLGSAVGSYDCPDSKPWSNSGSASTTIELTLAFTTEHVDGEDKAGLHHVGRSHKGKVEATVKYLGAPTLTLTGWKMTQKPAFNDANQQLDTWTYVGSKALARTTVSA